jgi:hypothetical protein
MEEQTKKKFLKSKLFLFAILPIFLIGSIFAIYVVNNLVLIVGVSEPFTVQYVVLGDAGTYTEGSCDNPELQWFTSTDINIPVGNMFPNEQRLVCVKITNAGEVTIPYTITSSVLNDNVNGDCVKAFGNHVIEGDADNGENTAQKLIVVPADAVPVSGCQVQISVTRG